MMFENSIAAVMSNNVVSNAELSNPPSDVDQVYTKNIEDLMTV